MGAVFEVVHVETQRRRALKVMLPELLANRQLRERFQMEARITANVESEYIVDVFDAGIDAATGMPFLVMELLNGEDLAKVLERTGPIPVPQVLEYLRQVGSALDKTHAAGIVHRDLKPENLFLTHREDGTPRVKILDFGISKVLHDATTGASATKGIGTPLYMAPEQVLAQPVTPATDLYALALIAYALLVGVHYWQSDVERFDNPIGFVVHTSKGVTDSACARALQAGHALPHAFDAWFRRATDLYPNRRFRDAHELVGELAAALGVTLQAYGSASAGFGPVGSAVRSRAAASAETMVARTAPGTELDRPRTLTGAAGRRKVMLGLVVGVLTVGVAVAGLMGAWHPGTSTSAEPTDTASTSLATSPSRAPEAPALAAPSSASPVPSAQVVASANPVPSANAAPAITKPSSPRVRAVTARPQRSPKYTRD